MEQRTITVVAIGVNASRGTRTVLSFAERDAVHVARVFTGAIAFPGTQSFCLVGAQATKRAVLELLYMLQARPPQHLVFFFSGHAGDQGIGLADGLLTHHQLRSALDHVPAHSLLSIFDSCHAAAHRRRASIGGLGSEVREHWMVALANMRPGARAMFGSASDRNAREDFARRHGRFTGAFLTSLFRAPGDPQWLGLFANERGVFDKAVTLLRRRYGDDQGAVGFNLFGDMPLVQSQELEAIGEAEVELIVPRAHELTIDVQIATHERAALPTRVICSVGRVNGPALGTMESVIVPCAADCSQIASFALPIELLWQDPALMRALSLGWSQPLVWHVRVCDQRGRVLAEDDASHMLSIRDGWLYAA